MKVHQFKHEMMNTAATFGRNGKVTVIFEGEQAAAKKDTIYLPAMDDNAILTPLEVAKMRGFVDHEAGHMRHTDMGWLHPQYKQWCEAGKTGLHDIHQVVEDRWIEPRIIRDYPGAWKNLSATSNWAVNKNFDALVEHKDHFLGKPNSDSIRLALHMVGDPGYNLEKREEVLSMINPRVVEHAKVWSEHIQQCESTQDTVSLAKAIYKTLEDDPNLEQDPQDFDPDNNEIDMSQGDNEQQQPMAGQKKPGEVGNESQPGGDDGDPVMGDLGDELNDDEDGIPSIGKPEGNHEGAYMVPTTAQDKYPTYKDPLHWTDLFNDMKGLSTYNSQSNQLGGSISVLSSKLRRALISRERRDWDPGKEQGRLDSKRLVSAYQGNRAVYKTRKDREELNTAVHILIDCSGSMFGTPIETAQECMVALSECLNPTSIKYQISGFTTVGFDLRYDYKKPWHRTQAIVHPVFKGFDQSLRTAKPALGNITRHLCLSNNADRDAVVWATNVLTRREEERKILIVLSDGHPAVASNNVSWREQGRHLKIAVNDAISQGVECVGLGMQSNAVKDYYPDYVVVNDINDFTGQAFNKFTQILLKGK